MEIHLDTDGDHQLGTKPYDKTFLHSSHINWFVTRVARRVVQEEFELLTLPGHMCSLQFVMSFILLLLYRKAFLHAYSFFQVWNYPTFVVSETLIYICSSLSSFSNNYLRWQNTKVVLSRKSNLGAMLLWKVCLSIGF